MHACTTKHLFYLYWEFFKSSMFRFLIISTAILFAFCLVGCKDHYNDTIHWMDNIPLGSAVGEVQLRQPDFVEIDWNNPDTVNGAVRFSIRKIKGSSDVLKMEHYLFFINDQYQGRLSRK